MPISHEIILPAALDFRLKEGITANAYDRHQGRHRNFLQGLGQRAAHRVQPWLAAFDLLFDLICLRGTH
jgi:hypothetical protein